jgi:hypothetical protein
LTLNLSMTRVLKEGRMVQCVGVCLLECDHGGTDRSSGLPNQVRKNIFQLDSESKHKSDIRWYQT